MLDLVIHVGPAKCGSTSIQNFFSTQGRPCSERTHFVLLDPVQISGLNHEEPDKSRLTAFTELLLSSLNECDVLILSHEFLFQCPYSIKNICSLAANLVSHISIIGYSRRQSDFIVSAYSQWLFRSPDRVKEATDVLVELEIDPNLFSGLERQLIASIVNDFYSARQLSNYSIYSIFDWHNSYQNILQLVRESGAVVKCGVLPHKGSGKSLIQDFCQKSNLTLRKETEPAGNKVANISFDYDLIEAINAAVILGLEVPGPHECNKDISMISNKMGRMQIRVSEFLSNLKAYIDTYYLHSNNQLCREFHLSKDYFSPSVQFSKPQILDMIRHEGQHRASHPSTFIKELRMQSAKMAVICLEMVKGYTDSQCK